MLFSLAMEAGCGPAEGGIADFWPTKRRAVPSAPGVGLDTSPRFGCCMATQGCHTNLLQIRQLATFRSLWFARIDFWFLYGNLLILLGESSRPVAFTSVRTRTCRMPSLRTKSISTKVTEEEYAEFEVLAGDQTISAWVRECLLKAAKPSPAEQTIVAELLALRMILMNILFSIANREALTSTAMDDIINRADAGKLTKAIERLTRATTEPQRG
jgi:hypothetical protein